MQKYFNSIKQFTFLEHLKFCSPNNAIKHKNDIIDNFCNEYKIKLIFSSSYKPSTNRVVIEITHMEIRKHIMLNIIENEEEFEINKNILEEINIHNNSIHTKTSYKPVE